ncbi:MAG TPA: DUF5947 family protein, partial [Streptosporangiaceae bacterium]
QPGRSSHPSLTGRPGVHPGTGGVPGLAGGAPARSADVGPPGGAPARSGGAGLPGGVLTRSGDAGVPGLPGGSPARSADAGVPGPPGGAPARSEDVGTPGLAGGGPRQSGDTGLIDLPGLAGRQSLAGGEESCEMCAARIPREHGHVADLDVSALLCACRSCYLLFTGPQAGRGRFRAVPDRYLCDPERPMSASDWDDLEIPVGLAFFLTSSRRDQVSGFYPSPAGVTECRLDLAAWERIAAAHPLLRAITPDVEAALISRTGDGVENFLVPVDACYELAGRMRLHWRGFDGGTEARQHIADFLADVRSRARPLAQGV